MPTEIKYKFRRKNPYKPKKVILRSILIKHLTTVWCKFEKPIVIVWQQVLVDFDFGQNQHRFFFSLCKKILDLYTAQNQIN